MMHNASRQQAGRGRRGRWIFIINNFEICCDECRQATRYKYNHRSAYIYKSIYIFIVRACVCVCKWIDCKAALPRPRRLFTVYFQRFRNKHKSEMWKKEENTKTQHGFLSLCISLFLSLPPSLSFSLSLLKQKYCILILIRNTRRFEGASHPKIDAKWSNTRMQRHEAGSGRGICGLSSGRRRRRSSSSSSRRRRLVCMAKVSSDDVCVCVYFWIFGRWNNDKCHKRGGRQAGGCRVQEQGQLHSYFNILFLVCCCLFSYF